MLCAIFVYVCIWFRPSSLQASRLLLQTCLTKIEFGKMLPRWMPKTLHHFTLVVFSHHGVTSRSPHSIVCLHPPSVANRAPEEARRRLASQLTEHREKLRSWDLEDKSEALARSEHAARVRRFAQSVQTSVAQASLAVTPRARTRRPSKVRDGGRIVFQPAPPGGPQVFRLRGSKAKPVLPCRQGCLCYVCESKRRIRHRRR